MLEELSDCVSGRGDPERLLEDGELIADLNAFLRSLPQEKRRMFLRRYWYGDPVAEIAKRVGMRENRVAVSLHRMRNALRGYLTERGHTI